jgi:hypothetical protein
MQKSYPYVEGAALEVFLTDRVAYIKLASATTLLHELIWKGVNRPDQLPDIEQQYY